MSGRRPKNSPEKNKLNLLITDGPPGVGCPVIASLGGASAVLVVAEPTVSGLHDMERVAQLAAHFKVPVMVCVNKFDLNFDQTEAIEKLAKENNMTIVGRVPFDQVFTESMVQGQTVLEYVGNENIQSSINEIWQNIRNQLAL